jgi:hypothetical protein
MPLKCAAFLALLNSIHPLRERTNHASCSDQLQKSLKCLQAIKQRFGEHALADCDLSAWLPNRWKLDQKTRPANLQSCASPAW